jgi:hypothetical protein
MPAGVCGSALPINQPVPLKRNNGAGVPNIARSKAQCATACWNAGNFTANSHHDQRAPGYDPATSDRRAIYRFAANLAQGLLSLGLLVQRTPVETGACMSSQLDFEAVSGL